MSRDILMDHIYKTPGEARRASNMLGLGGVIHSHETPQGVIYMPGSVSPSRQNLKEVDRLARERRLLEEERKKLEAAEERQRQAQAKKKPTPQSGTGSGFFVSKMGHVITNAHVVQNCNKVTIGDNANKQVPAELINTDRSNDLALLKLSTLVNFIEKAKKNIVFL